MVWPKILAVIALMGVDIYLLINAPAFFDSVGAQLIFASILALITTIILFRLTQGIVREVMLTGSALGYLAAYHFYFQPTLPLILPQLSGPVLWFFGTIIVIRATIFLVEVFPIPVVTPLVEAAIK